MSANAAEIMLPGGLWNGGTRQPRVMLRSLCGLDQRYWLELPAREPLVTRLHGLLSRCIVAAGEPPRPLEAVPDWVQSLTIGDREALLLHLHRLSFGSRIECVLACPACGEKLELDLAADDLLLPPYAGPQREYVDRLDGCTVRFRLPTGADQAAVAALARADLDAAEAELAERCVYAVDREGEPSHLTPSIVRALADRMAELDPQAELNLDMTCPTCEAPFSALLDMAQFVGAEVSSRSQPLDREIHALALTYHWSEEEILGLPVGRRHAYLRLLDETGSLPGGAM